MTIKNNGKEPLKITGWRCQLAGFKLTIPAEPIEPGKTRRCDRRISRRKR